MSARRGAAVAAIGWALGTCLGWLDGLAGIGASLASTRAPVGVGVLVDGAVGLGLGLLAGRFVTGPRRVWPAVLVAVVATLAGVRTGFGAPPPPLGADLPVVPGRAANALWIAVDGLGTEDLARMPFVRGWSAHALQLTGVMAASTDRTEALEAVLAGRRPEGRVDGAPRVVDVWRALGAVTLAVTQRDDADERALWRGFSAVAPGWMDVGPRALGTWLARWLPAPRPAPSDAVRVARRLLAQVGDRRSFLAVELPAEASPEALDDAIRVLVGLATAQRAERDTVVLLSGITGAPDDDGGLPTLDASTAPAWLAVPGVAYADGRVFPGVLEGVDLLPNLLFRAAALRDLPFDGRLLDRRTLDREQLVRLRSQGVVTSGDPEGCSFFHARSWDGVATTVVGVAGGTVTAIRGDGYVAVRTPGGPVPALYDEVADPYWVHDLVALDARTCEGIAASARADQLIEAAEARATDSRERAGRTLSLLPMPLGPPHDLYPDPLAGLVGH